MENLNFDDLCILDNGLHRLIEDKQDFLDSVKEYLQFLTTTDEFIFNKDDEIKECKEDIFRTEIQLQKYLAVHDKLDVLFAHYRKGFRYVP